jgi:hypothetical protein
MNETWNEHADLRKMRDLDRFVHIVIDRYNQLHTQAYFNHRAVLYCKSELLLEIIRVQTSQLTEPVLFYLVFR